MCKKKVLIFFPHVEMYWIPLNYPFIRYTGQKYITKNNNRYIILLLRFKNTSDKCVLLIISSQIDLGTSVPVHGIGTLGHYNKTCWVEKYKVYVSNSDDEDSFVALKDKDTGMDRVSTGCGIALYFPCNFKREKKSLIFLINIFSLVLGLRKNFSIS